MAIVEEVEPELLAIGKTLRRQFKMHINQGRSGHLYGYDIVDARGRIEASKSVWRGTVKGTERENVCYAMGDAHFDNLGDFLKAYRQRLRDEEFDAAAPKAASS